MATQVQQALLCSCKDNMDKDVEKDPTLKGDQESRGEKANAPASSRRRFTRNALVGGSVIVSLANRPAWGNTLTPDDLRCVSAGLFHSFDTVGQVSLGPAGSYKDLKYDDYRDIITSGGQDRETFEGSVCPLQPEEEGLELQSFNTEFFPTSDKSKRQINVMKEKKEK